MGFSIFSRFGASLEARTLQRLGMFGTFLGPDRTCDRVIEESLVDCRQDLRELQPPDVAGEKKDKGRSFVVGIQSPSLARWFARLSCVSG